MAQSPDDADQVNKAEYTTAWKTARVLADDGMSWSGSEKNCTFLNTGQGTFATASAVSGIGFADDGRGAAAVDWDLDGDLDLWTSNRSGPRLRFFRNDAGSRQGFVAVQLVGTAANRDAIGARVEVHAGGRKAIQTLKAGDGFMAQSSKWLHFGLGSTDGVDRLVVRWPGGPEESFTGLEVNRRYVIRQGSGEATPWSAPSRSVALEPSLPVAPVETERARVVIAARTPLPSLAFEDFGGTLHNLSRHPGRSLLLNLWSSRCAPCAVELAEFHATRERLESAELDVICLSLDRPEDHARAAEMVRTLGLEFPAGVAPRRVIDVLETIQRTHIGQSRALALPSSFLIDPENRLAIIYRGKIEVDALLADLPLLGLEGDALRNASSPFEGRWLEPTPGPPVDQLAEDFMHFDLPQIALELLGGNPADKPSDGPSDGFVRTKYRLRGNVYLQNAERLAAEGDPDGARTLYESALAAYDRALKRDPESASEISNNTGVILARLGRDDEAVVAYESALSGHPFPAAVHLNLGRLHLEKQRLEKAESHLRSAIALAPTTEAAHLELARVMMARRDLGAVEKVYRDALALGVEDPELRVELAHVLVLQRKLDEAQEHLRAALDREPEHFRALREMGFVEFLRQRHREALEWLEKARARNGRDAETLLVAGTAEIFLENREGAERYLKILRNVNEASARKLQAEIDKRLGAE